MASNKLMCGCGGEIVVRKGSETSSQLECSKCGDYLYYVGGIACVSSTEGVIPSIGRAAWVLLCGDPVLRPEVLEKINAWRRHLSLLPLECSV